MTRRKTVADYIATLDDRLRTEEEMYRRRLDACRSCEGLVNGACRFCGCFVEIRAARKDQGCPGIPSRW